MKICHVINSLSGGGAETHLLELVHAQKEHGHIVNVIATGPDKKNMKSLEQEFTNISVIFFELSIRPFVIAA